jgi:syntaxin 16
LSKGSPSRNMTSRDRTSVFKRYRAEARLALGERSALEELKSEKQQAPAAARAGVTQVAKGVALLPPRWVDLHESIQEDLATIRSGMDELENMRRKLLLPEFADKSEEEYVVDKKTAEVARLFQSCEAKVRQLSELVHEISLSRTERTIRENVQKKHAMQVQELSIRFRREQRRFLDRLRKADADNALALRVNGALFRTKAGANDSMDDNHPDNFSTYDPGFNESQLALWRHAEMHAGARYEEARRIARSIQELSGIMRDLSLLVTEQGSIIDRIDYNIEQADMEAEQALKQLQRARRTQKRGWIHYCTLILALGCVVLFLILVLKWI